ncbi:MAG: hypothetical protein KIT79_08010 [Deltaproteobacteria bacterium]|nr:hypothetical protein [Deltaproteobacteria bacterium]
MTLGQYLVKNGFATPAQIDDALNLQVVYGGRLGTNLLEVGALDERTLAKALSKYHKVKALDPTAPLTVRPDAFELISRHFARKYNCIPMWTEGQKLYVATSDPRNQFSLEAIARVTGRQIVPLVMPELKFHAALEKFYNIKRELRFVTLSMKLIERERRKKAQKVKPKEEAPKAAPPTEDLMPEEVFEGQIASLQERQGMTTAPLSGDHPFGDTEAPAAAAKARAPAASAPPSMPPGDPNAQTHTPFAGKGVQVIDREALARAEAESADEILEIDDADIIEIDDADIIEEVVYSQSADAAPEEILEADEAELEAPKFTAIDLKTAQQMIADARNRDDIARAALSLALNTMSRALIFIVKGNLVMGWDGAGEQVDRGTIQSLVLPLNVPSAFKFVFDTRAPFVGPLPANETNDQFLKLLGGARPKSSVIFPILFRGRVVNVIYADSGPGKLASTDISDLQILSPKIPATFDRILNERKRKVSG